MSKKQYLSSLIVFHSPIRKWHLHLFTLLHSFSLHKQSTQNKSWRFFNPKSFYQQWSPFGTRRKRKKEKICFFVHIMSMRVIEQKHQNIPPLCTYNHFRNFYSLHMFILRVTLHKYNQYFLIQIDGILTNTPYTSLYTYWYHKSKKKTSQLPVFHSKLVFYRETRYCQDIVKGHRLRLR